MPFPDLVRKTGGVLHSQATGIPDDGNNTFALDIPLSAAIDENWLEFLVVALGPSVQGATFVGLSADRTQVTLNFTQIGNDQATVCAKLVHTVVR
jgi:hypothetical protein